MNWLISPRLCKIFGVPLHLHCTFLLFLVVVAIFYPWYLLTLVLLFASVVAHEYGHVMAARFYEVNCERVVLTPLGGIAFLERMPRDPVQELVITAAGPLVSLLLCLWSGALAIITFSFTDVFVMLCAGNGVLFLFNVLPVFPLDGGRILRSVLQYAMSYKNATKISVRVSQFMCLSIGLIGIINFNFMLVVTMIFVAYLSALELRRVDAEV